MHSHAFAAFKRCSVHMTQMTKTICTPPTTTNRSRTCTPMHTHSIQALLSAPNPDDPLADNVAQHWKSDEPAAIRTGDFSP